jgi:hypothetical protein
MNCCGEKRGAGFWIKRAIFIPIAIAAGVTLFGFVVMHLWNWLMPMIFGLGIITFWQALGLLILSKILFGGFKSCHSNHRYHHDHFRDWHGRFRNMSPEAKEKMKTEWKERGCCSEEKKEE